MVVRPLNFTVSSRMHVRSPTLAFVLVAAAFGARAEAPTELNSTTLEAAAVQWSHSAVQNYQFTFRYVEFASPCVTWAFRVRVVHGMPEHRRDCREYRVRFSTVPLLFEYLRRSMTEKHYSVRAEFDPKFGYPAKGFVAWSQAADDFFSFEVTDFRTAEK